MIIVEICIGSACYVKGSNQLVNQLQSLIDEKNWNAKVTLKGAFCMQVCSDGLGIRVNGKHLRGLNIDNALDAIQAEIESSMNA